MNRKIKHFISLASLTIFLVFAVGSTDDSSSSSSKSSSRKSSSSVSLCKCKNSGPYYDRNTSACKSKFRSKWGSSSPSVDQMLYYCESYCGNCY